MIRYLLKFLFTKRRKSFIDYRANFDSIKNDDIERYYYMQREINVHLFFMNKQIPSAISFNNLYVLIACK